MDYTQSAGSIGGGIALQSAVNRQVSRVEAAQAGLDKITSSLHETISELERRLQPVLGPTKPSGVGEASAPPASVAAKIEQSARIVGTAGERLADIINRLEI